ncbi:hypothetical protein D3C81_2323620 [compost metagenome]
MPDSPTQIELVVLVVEGPVLEWLGAGFFGWLVCLQQLELPLCTVWLGTLRQ